MPYLFSSGQVQPIPDFRAGLGSGGRFHLSIHFRVTAAASPPGTFLAGGDTAEGAHDEAKTDV
jgi:hypothetical protein